MALRVANIAGSILNVPDNGDAAPCPSLWSFGVEPEPALVLLGWMVHYSCLLMNNLRCVGNQFNRHLAFSLSILGGVHFLLGTRTNDDAFDETITPGNVKHNLLG